MKSITSVALALAAALTVPSALADSDPAQPKSEPTAPKADNTPPKSKCVPPISANCPNYGKKATPGAAKPKAPETAKTEEPKTGDAKAEETAEAPSEAMPAEEPAPETPPPPPPAPAYGGGPPPTTVTEDTSGVEAKRVDDELHVRKGFGISAFGSAGAADEARWGVGGRLEYVFKFGLAVGGSYAVHYETEGNRTLVRPLLAEVGWAFPIVNHLEVRPMVGVGWAFAKTERRETVTNAEGQTVRSQATVTDGFDFAPGAKLSYVARMLEVYLNPKYHFISGNNFAAIELGAGARF